MSKALDGGGGVSQTKFDVTEANKFDSIQRTRMANSYVVWQSDSQSQGDFQTAVESKQDDLWEFKVSGSNASTVTRRYQMTRLQVTGPDTSVTLCARNYPVVATDATLHTFIQFAYIPMIARNSADGSNGVTYSIGVTGQRANLAAETVALNITGSLTETTETFTLTNGLNYGNPNLQVPNSTVPQSNWNIDRLDGTGPSKINISQRSGDSQYPYVISPDENYVIRGFTLVISSFGGPMGSTRIGFVFDNAIYYIHEFSVARNNVFPSVLLSAYPLRFHSVPIICVKTDSTAKPDILAANLVLVRASVIAEGPLPMSRPSHARSFNTGTSAINSGINGVFNPLLAIGTANAVTVNGMRVNHSIAPQVLTICNTGSTTVAFRMVLNANLVGQIFTDVDAYKSCAGLSTSVTLNTAVSPVIIGTTVFGGFVSAGAVMTYDLSETCGKRPIGKTAYLGTNETYTLAATTADGSACGLLVDLHWHEFH